MKTSQTWLAAILGAALLCGCASDPGLPVVLSREHGLSRPPAAGTTFAVQTVEGDDLANGWRHALAAECIHLGWRTSEGKPELVLRGSLESREIGPAVSSVPSSAQAAGINASPPVDLRIRYRTTLRVKIFHEGLKVWSGSLRFEQSSPGNSLFNANGLVRELFKDFPGQQGTFPQNLPWRSF